MGLCGFNYSRETQTYEASAFNMYLNPYTNRDFDIDSVFKMELEPLNFMMQHGFDFNKQMYSAVHYLKWQDYLKLE